jgi:DNA replication protein DnaC
MENLSNAGKYTLQFINQTNRSIFLTGKAGTGKTTLLKEIIQTTHKNVVVVAPTGIAALNACWSNHSFYVSIAFWRFYSRLYSASFFRFGQI